MGFVKRNGLTLAFGGLFVGTLIAQAFVGLHDFNASQVAHHGDPITLVGSVAVLAIYLRQRGSPESKPVGAAHSATGVEG